MVELRRRVEQDPASIAFAQLAEEHRRAGDHDEAARLCRAGLMRHPGYLSARVTLGLALIALERLDEAEDELTIVLKTAPENLAAIRGRAEIHQRRGALEPALDFYQRALGLARHDADLEQTIQRIGTELGRTPPPAPPKGGHSSPETTFDFERLARSLGVQPDTPVSSPPSARRGGAEPADVAGAPLDLSELAAKAEAGDDLATLELQLRTFDPAESALAAARSQVPPGDDETRQFTPADREVLRQLSAWLEVLSSSGSRGLGRS